MVGSIGSAMPEKEKPPLSDARADRLDALRNLAFLMRVDIDQQENLREYLQYMDLILARMKEDEGVRHS
jgi:hypothetical protein